MSQSTESPQLRSVPLPADEIAQDEHQFRDLQRTRPQAVRDAFAYAWRLYRFRPAAGG